MFKIILIKEVSEVFAVEGDKEIKLMDAMSDGLGKMLDESVYFHLYTVVYNTMVCQIYYF